METDFFETIVRSEFPYVIAELGSNHNGDEQLAKKLIIAAKDAGADCVKFQSWTKDSIFSRAVYDANYFLNDDYRKRKDFTLEEIVEKYSVSERELLNMSIFAREVGIDCTSTPFSKKEVDFLAHTVRPLFIKIASMDVNNYPFLEYAAKTGLPIVISTGLSELSEIDKAIRTIEKAGNTKIIICHCVSLYPPKDEEVNLSNLMSLGAIYPYPIGFSDHTIGFSIPLAAVAMGARLIEKHFTLDKTMPGWDHAISASPEEMRIICSESKRIVRAKGDRRIVCVESEERKAAFRRSIVATRMIRAGEKIQAEDLDMKRPGTGIAPEYLAHVIGRQAKVDLAFDKPFQFDDLV